MGQAEAAATIAEMLGDLPLALEQAGAYCDAVGLPLAAYVEQFAQHRQELLQRGGTATDYPDTVATTWEMAFKQLQQTAPAATELLNLCAFLAPDDIPRALFYGGREHLPEPLAAAIADSIGSCIRALRIIRLDLSRAVRM
jgi:hypothetical protein